MSITVKEFIMQHIDTEDKIDSIRNEYKQKYPLFEDYELDSMTGNEIKRVEEWFEKAFRNFIERIKSADTFDSGKVLFVVRQHSLSYGEPDTYASWMSKKEDIKAKAGVDTTLWSGSDETRIEHYGYDMRPLEAVLGAEIYIYGDIPTVDAVCEIINELTMFGWEEPDRSDRIEEVVGMLEQTIDDIENGIADTVDADEVFRKLEEEILSNASDEERKKIISEKEERKKYEERDNKYSIVMCGINHRECINAVTMYYLQEMLATEKA